MKFIDTERQLADIFTKSLNSSHFAFLPGGDWFEGELVICFIYLYIFIFLLHFFHTHLSRLASPVILACISSIMLIIVLG
jgi:hypothetical protein